MAKPPPEVQAAIVALPRNDPSRGPELLHVTLISLYDLHYAPPEWLPAWPSDDRRTRIVFITRDIDPDAIEETLRIFERRRPRSPSPRP